ncbi:enoyl-CoA hydratase-related protein [Bradyrhizobium sp. LHD-71]|uniref:enoyl-CoA hydratase/isomerase family protein n=1 Tax=Bradyrhizobium sp. LHD-71 TaxID=3072141 RepID=UPI00280EA799|nr:enoyl-CoA hydratase-related protein [Bradyrhizobium sp. LHD-71]MDQ8729329.1 enoyl-CoA hydratase-related protein [Bradyrhizobium sp. LHD-71]
MTASTATAASSATSTATPLLESRDGRIVTLTLNRPERLNALSAEMSDMLYEAVIRTDKDPDVGVVIVTGAGRGFCAGGDVKNMAERKNPNREERLEHLKRSHRVPLAMRNSSKVFISAINGPATGAGLGIATVGDIRIAARSARFGAAFANVGLAGDWGVSWLLTRTIGPSMARQMLLSAELIDAARALQIGLVHNVVDDAALMDEAKRIATRYAEGPGMSFKLIKQNLLHAEGATFAESLDVEAENQATAMMTEDHKEAVAAFLGKRKGNFKGR